MSATGFSFSRWKAGPSPIQKCSLRPPLKCELPRSPAAKACHRLPGRHKIKLTAEACRSEAFRVAERNITYILGLVVGVGTGVGLSAAATMGPKTGTRIFYEGVPVGPLEMPVPFLPFTRPRQLRFTTGRQCKDANCAASLLE